jgi:hypothetical protein
VHKFHTVLLETFGDGSYDDIELLTYFFLKKLYTLIIRQPMVGFSKQIGSLKLKLINQPEFSLEYNDMARTGYYDSVQYLNFAGNNKHLSFLLRVAQVHGKYLIRLCRIGQEDIIFSNMNPSELENFNEVMLVIGEPIRNHPNVVSGELITFIDEEN